MKKRLISICIIALMILCSKSVFAGNNASIKAEIRRHREAIRQLEQQFRSSQGSDYEGTGEGLPDNASVDRPWKAKADLNSDGVVDKTEKQRWGDRRANREEGNPPGPQGGPGVGRGNPPGPKGGPGKGQGHITGTRDHGKGLGKGKGQGKGQGFKGNPPGPKGGPGKGQGHIRGTRDHGKGLGKGKRQGKGPKNQKGGARGGGRKGRR